VTSGARGGFDAHEILIACAVAVLAQLGFVAAFSMPSPALVEAEISNDNAQPIAVSITPVLKLGSKTPSKVPSPWQRKRPVAAKSEPQATLPSTQAEKTPPTLPTAHVVADAGIAPAPPDASPSAPSSQIPQADDAASAAPAASTQGSELGAANGTETDPLKARAADRYRGQLASWFAAHFRIRGKLPFDKLKTLHASANISISADRRVTGFALDHPSGDETFDAEVRSSIAQIQASGVELPAPPPNYPDILHETLRVGFECTVQRLCE
jgi:hypothetical protein